VCLLADSSRLEQVLSNLLTNAAKYTDPGGRIWLTAERASQGREPAEIVLRVRDTGMGIPPEVLPSVFDLFAQGERACSRSEGGLGIGLALARTLVQAMGGDIHTHSAGPGQGSEFVVRLPAAPAAARG
jgi:signal transduction histidine kinase